MAKQHDKQFKLDAVQYYQDHNSIIRVEEVPFH